MHVVELANSMDDGESQRGNHCQLRIGLEILKKSEGVNIVVDSNIVTGTKQSPNYFLEPIMDNC